MVTTGRENCAHWPSSLAILLSRVYADSPGELLEVRLYLRKPSLYLAASPITKDLPDPFS